MAQQQAQTAEPGEPGTRAALFEENGEAVNVPQGEQPATTSAPIEQTPEGTPGRPQAVPNVPVAQAPERGGVEAQPESGAQALPSWENLSQEERDAKTAQVKTGFLRAYKNFKPYFDALGVEFQEDPYSDVAVATSGSGQMHLWFGAEHVAQMLHEYQQRGSEVPTFHTILQHELIHGRTIIS